MQATHAFLALTGLSLIGCVPSFEDDSTRVTEPRVLALRSTPAEAAEGDTVEIEPLVAAPPDVDGATPSLLFCLDRKPLTELGPVNPTCVASPEPIEGVTQAFEPGAPLRGALPDIACQLFGPERPEPEPGQPAGRPVDPDLTGGFYQPVAAWLEHTVVLGGVRLSCPLVGASVDATRDYNQRYRPNENPEILALELERSDGSTLELGDDEASVRRGERVRLRVTWPACPASDVCGDGICGPGEGRSVEAEGCAEDCAPAQGPRGCTGAERYVMYDPLSASVVEQRERVLVSWYASAGKLDGPRTDLQTDAELPASGNGFVAPSAGAFRIWAVLRDDRGGVTWRSGALRIAE
jgi:hypothetical protein